MKSLAQPTVGVHDPGPGLVVLEESNIAQGQRPALRPCPGMDFCPQPCGELFSCTGHPRLPDRVCVGGKDRDSFSA